MIDNNIIGKFKVETSKIKNKHFTYSNNSIKNKQVAGNVVKRDSEKSEKNHIMQTEQNTLSKNGNNNMTISYKKLPLNTASNENNYFNRKISDGNNKYFNLLKKF